MPTPMGHPATRRRARRRPRPRSRDARAHARAGSRSTATPRTSTGVNRVGALLREAFALPVARRARRSRAATATATTWCGAPRARRARRSCSSATTTPCSRPATSRAGARSGNRATGPGVLDMKGGLAVIRTALAALDDVGVLATLPVVVVCVADEEVGSPTSAPHLRELATRRRVRARVRVGPRERHDHHAAQGRRRDDASIAHGKAAHAGNNHKDGANAIWALAKFVDAAQQLTDYARGVTVNVGKVTGGTAKNTVPERAECELDLRFETVADAEALVAALRAAAEAAAAAVPGVALEVDGGVEPPAARAHRRVGRAARRVRRVRARVPASATARRRCSAAAPTRTPSRRSASPRSTASARAAPASTRRPSTSSSPRSCRRPRRSCASCRSAACASPDRCRAVTHRGATRYSSGLREACSRASLERRADRRAAAISLDRELGRRGCVELLHRASMSRDPSRAQLAKSWQ